jgi:hypothetical protein
LMHFRRNDIASDPEIGCTIYFPWGFLGGGGELFITFRLALPVAVVSR